MAQKQHSFVFQLVVATLNAGKLREIKSLLSDLPIEILSLENYPDAPISAEAYSTYLENARDKARLVARHTGTWALADDSGLEVRVLNGRPGIHSSRFAGDGATDAQNVEHLIRLLRDVPQTSRQAAFCCVMVLSHPSGQEFVTKGRLDGEIATSPRGASGFGYDPVFFLPHLDKTVAEIGVGEKNKISHRTKALQKMKEHLLTLINKPHNGTCD